MNTSTDDFVEIPRWARLLNGEGWYKGALPGRRDLHIAEAIFIGLATIYFATSFFVSSALAANILRYGALLVFVGCYFNSVGVRITDTYKLWPTDEGASFRKEFFRRKFFGFGKSET